MKKIVNDSRLMIKVCDLYYNQGLNHQQIADMINVSRPTIAKIISSSLDSGVVSIKINNLDSIKFWDLEQKLKNKYALKDVVIVDSVPNQKETLGLACAKYLNNIVKNGDIVGVSMGETLNKVAYAPIEPSSTGLTFIPLIGGMGQLGTQLHSNHIAEKMASVYNGKFIPLYAPARVSSSKARNEFIKEKSVAEVLKFHKDLDIALVGIGYPNENSSIKATNYFRDNEIESLIDREVVGDICMQFYDKNGDTSPYKNDNNVIALNINKLKKIPYSIGVAGNIDKLSAIKGAIKGSYINVLITDFECAEAMLSDSGRCEA